MPNELSSMIERLSTVDVSIRGDRGIITDRNGKIIANNIQKIWDKKYKTKITYVKGDEWQAGNLSYHLTSRPKWLAVSSDKIIRSKDIMRPNEIKIPVKLYGGE